VTTALVFAAGPALGDNALRWLRAIDNPFVLAADSGYDRAMYHGFEADVLVGDLDSISAAGLEHAQDAGVEILRMPAHKDITDLEAAMAHAAGLPITRMVAVVSMMGRVDHALGVIATLSAPWDVPTEALLDNARGYVVRGQLDVALPVGATISLLALGGDAHGVSTRGLEYPLRDETLSAHAARGVSNQVARSEVSIAVRSGAVLVLHAITHDV
jgi:thiamine pyrophosphokinase